MTQTNFPCPVCKCKMHSQLSATEGVTVFCAAPPEVCPAQEVMGHGDNEKKAYEIVQEKFSHRAEWFKSCFRNQYGKSSN